MAKKAKTDDSAVRSIAYKPHVTKVTFTCSACKSSKDVAFPEMAPYMELSQYECDCGEKYNFTPPVKIGAMKRSYD